MTITMKVEQKATKAAVVPIRIYMVTEEDNEAQKTTQHLVRAVSQAQAIAFLAKKRYHVVRATTNQVATLMTTGTPVQDATAHPEPEAAINCTEDKADADAAS